MSTNEMKIGPVVVERVDGAFWFPKIAGEVTVRSTSEEE